MGVGVGVDANGVICRELTRAENKAVEENLPDLLSNVYGLKGMTYEQLGPAYYHLAEEAFLRSVQISPNVAAHHTNAGNFFSKLQKHDVRDSVHS
jgi:hypothetical protein